MQDCARFRRAGSTCLDVDARFHPIALPALHVTTAGRLVLHQETRFLQFMVQDILMRVQPLHRQRTVIDTPSGPLTKSPPAVGVNIYRSGCSEPSGQALSDDRPLD
jgi:hypothetical protein